MKKLTGNIIMCLCCVALTSVAFYYFALPKIIESRARDLNLTRYDGSKGTFVAKDSLYVSKYDIYYLQHGNMKGYK